MLAIESMLDELALRIQVINDAVGVFFRACREDGHFIVSIRCYKQFFRMRSDIETDIVDNLPTRRRDVDLCVGLSEWIRLLDAMHQCFV